MTYLYKNMNIQLYYKNIMTSTSYMNRLLDGLRSKKLPFELPKTTNQFCVQVEIPESNGVLFTISHPPPQNYELPEDADPKGILYETALIKDGKLISDCKYNFYGEPSPKSRLTPDDIYNELNNVFKYYQYHGPLSEKLDLCRVCQDKRYFIEEYDYLTPYNVCPVCVYNIISESIEHYIVKPEKKQL